LSEAAFVQSAVLITGPFHRYAERTARVMTGDPRSASARPCPGRRLLVVDDDQIIMAAFRSGLGLHDYEVTTTSNGFEALAAVATMVPDLVVLDLGMPAMSGRRLVVLSADPDGHDDAQP